MLSFLFLAAIVASSAPPLIVEDETDRPLSGASVDFAAADGRHDLEKSDAAGGATPRAHFEAVAADVTLGGYSRVHVVLGAAPRRVVLTRVLPVIGSVAIATGSRQTLHELPFAASALDRTAIALSPAATSDRLLRELPGADETRSNSAFTNYGDVRASFSGAGLDRGVVLVDGFPAQDAFGGQIDWEAYPSDLIERAELLRGAGSALYGSGGVGGVLELDTFGPHPGPSVAPAGWLRFGNGSDALLDDAFAYSTPLGPAVAASLAAVSSRLEYQDLPPAYSAPIVHPAKSTSGVTNLRLAYGQGRTTIDGGVLFASDHQDEGLPNYTFDRFLRQEQVRAAQRIGDDALATFGYYVRDTTIYNLDDVFPTDPAALRYIQHVPTDENGFFGTFTAAAGPLQYDVRVDQRRVDGRAEQYGPSGARQSLGTGTEVVQGLALQFTYRLKRFEAVGGARGDRLRYDDLSLLRTSGTPPVTANTIVAGHAEGAVSPRLALRYDVGSRLVLRASSGGGFRGPYLNELVRGFNVGAVFDAPNPELVPERSRTDGAGADYLLGNARIAFDVFATHVTDAIAFVTESKTLMMRENLSRTQTDGETLTYATPLGACTRLRASGTAQYARVTSGPAGTIGKQLELVPNRSADIGLDAAGRGPLSYSIDAAYVGQTYADSLQKEPLGAALLFGATVRARTISGVTFTLVGDNLTHQTYLTDIDRFGPPLTVALKIGFPLGPPPPAAGCGS